MSPGNAERLEFALLAMSGAHPADQRKADTLQLSSECMAPINDIVAKAKMGNTRPILQLACSMGLSAGDVIVEFGGRRVETAKDIMDVLGYQVRQCSGGSDSAALAQMLVY